MKTWTPDPRTAREPMAALNRVRIDENHDPLVDIRDRCPTAIVLDRACPFLRRHVADLLNAALGSLPAGLNLQIGTGMRTIGMQSAGWDRYHAQLRADHPNWPLSTLRRATNRFFAPYDQPAPPGHCTGGAVDVTLLNEAGEIMDVTSPLEGWTAAPTWSARISETARTNRMVLVDAMLGAGFSNCRDEYWHYSWGDSAWAVRTGQTECPYGLIEPPVCVETQHVGGMGDVRRCGPNQWEIQADRETNHFDVAILWGAGKSVELKVPAAPTTIIETSEAREAWEVVSRSTGTHCVRLDLSAERMYARSRPAGEPDA